MVVEIRPQPKQEQFLASPADIAIYGGAAGAGKSWSLLIEALRHVTTNQEFYAVYFRRTTPQIRNPGGLWDESCKLYIDAGGVPVQTILEWKWAKGGRVKFSHLEHEKSVYDWQGASCALLCFDEITHFTESQFFYMLSRNRTMCGVNPYVRATCNPDADSWVAKFLAWWIDGAGYPYPDRSGVLRWFVRKNGEICWADTREDCIREYGDASLSIDDALQVQPKSVTFVSARLQDNQKLMQSDPQYVSNLQALDLVSQARLLGGNWKIRYETGMEIFTEASLLVDGLPVPYPQGCDYVYATIDTASKTGKLNDGTAVTYWAKNTYGAHQLIILDYELQQIEGSLLIVWLPNVIRRLEELVRLCGARQGSIGVFIEDKSSGITLLQEARRQQLPATPIPSSLTKLGKEVRGINISGFVYNGKVKFSDFAYNKVVRYKDVTKNHQLVSVTGFRIGGKDQADDGFDTFCYGVAIGLGNPDGM